MNELLQKYDIPVPRYTSYPTVPYWDQDPPAIDHWEHLVKAALNEDNSLSLYIHLPFCENLCTYCGCNKRITKNHTLEKPYIDAVLKEWQIYLSIFSKTPILKELHLGGGTPTFFQPEELARLIDGIKDNVLLAEDYEFSFEAHPSNTTYDHLAVLYQKGFRRISIGVQDFSNTILQIINRRQTAESVEYVTLKARELGYESINYDIIFGLPLQTERDIRYTVRKIKNLKPDRIAFYSYAHVPWIKPSQRAYSEKDLPKGAAKRSLYELGRYLLEEIGYREIGMDHFALTTDSLYKAMIAGKMHRNFMGYSAQYTKLSIGLGVSSISDSWTAYAQNEKKIEDYQDRVSKGALPIFKGHVLNQEDLEIRQHILNLMCRQKTTWYKPTQQTALIYNAIERLEALEKDGLVEINPFELKVTERGRCFIRNICLAFDTKYWRKKPQGALFSQSL